VCILTVPNLLSSLDFSQDPSSPLLQSDKAFQIYLTSLLKTGLESSVNPAVRRRDSLLASSTAESNHLVSPQTIEPPSSSSRSDGLSSSSQPLATSGPSRSQKVAQAVLSGQLAGSQVSPLSLNPSGGIHTADMAKLVTALNSGAGISGNPLHVAISERE